MAEGSRQAMEKRFYTYIATNQRNTVLYTGITSHIYRRMFEHKTKIQPGFTQQYNIDKLVWFQEFHTAEEAIAAEKKIKGWLRKKKIALINEMNPGWRDLFASC